MVELYLKILSGNHIGAEIPLEPGRYSLGRDENCDLVLSDASINEIELILEISDDGQIRIQTSTAEDPLHLNGQPIGSNLQCNYFDIVSSSGLFFALGPVDTQWPDLILPTLQIPESEDYSENGTEDNEPDAGDNFPDPGVEEGKASETSDEIALADVIESLEENDEEYDDDDEEEEEEGEGFFKNSINTKFLVAVPIAIISVISILIAIIPRNEPPPPFPPSFLDEARQARQELGLKDIYLKELNDKSIMVTGYTLTSRTKQELQKLLRTRGVPFNSQVVAMNELRSNANDFLKNRGYENLLLELDNTPGSLVLTGYIATSEELNNLITSMKQEIHGLVAVVDQVENQTSRMNILNSMIRERKLANRVHLSERRNTIIVQGHLLDDSQSYNLQDMVQRFRDRYGNNPKLVISTRPGDKPPAGTNIPNSASQIVLPALAIRGISMGRVPYVVMEDGSKYLVGAKLANGYIIEDINLEYLLLTNGTERIKYRLGGNRGGQQ